MNNGNAPFAVYLDLSKPFDALDQSILLDKLKCYGFRRTSINLKQHYLSNRKQSVEIDSFPNFPNASRLFKCIIYADDTTLFSNLNDVYAKYDSELNIKQLSDELEKNKLLVTT